MSRRRSQRVWRRALAVLALSLLTAKTLYAQQTAPIAGNPSTAALAATSTPWTSAPANSSGAATTGVLSPLPAVQLSASTAPPSELEPLPDPNDSATVQEIMRRLEQTEAELAALRAQASAAANGGPNTQFASMQQNGSRTSQRGVEDRIRQLEQAAQAAREKLPLVRLSGFFQLDNAEYSQDAASKLTYGDMQNGTGFRRTRLQAVGSLSEFTNFSIEMDFAAAGRPSFLDVWGEQTNLGWLGTVRIGQFRQPTTMDALTSVRHLEFLERSDAFQAMDPFRKVGIMSYNISENRRTTWAGSVYATGFTFLNPTTSVENYGTLGDTRFGTYVGDNGGVSTAYRVTHLLWYDELTEGRSLLHVGAGYNFSSIGGNGGTPGSTNGHTYEARTIPGQFVGDPDTAGVTANGTPFVTNTGLLPAKSYDYWHTELAGQYGSAHFQTEFMATQLNTIGYGQALVTGMYFQGGYFLTGEQCGYNRLQGVFDYNVNPYTQFFGLGNGRGIAGWGAWEVAYRFDYVDTPYVVGAVTPPSAAAVAAGTTNAGTSGSNANPGELYQNNIALNWWWNQYTRVQFNYINVYNQGTFAVYGNSHTNIYAARFQIEF